MKKIKNLKKKKEKKKKNDYYLKSLLKLLAKDIVVTFRIIGIDVLIADYYFFFRLQFVNS